MGLKARYFITSRTTNEANEIAVGGNEGAGSELGSSPKNETLGSTPNTISTGMSFAKVKNGVVQGITTVLMHTDL